MPEALPFLLFSLVVVVFTLFAQSVSKVYQKRINGNSHIILYMTKSVSTLYQKRINAIHETESDTSVPALLQLR